jgi:predicted Fe-S protein YdhL (DUF1289 family)
MQEIAAWTTYSAAQKRVVLSRLVERRGKSVRSA